MLSVTNLVTPSPEQFQMALKGMRNAFKSWDKSDTHTVTKVSPWFDTDDYTNYYLDGEAVRGKDVYDILRSSDQYHVISDGDVDKLLIGKKDINLLLNLCKAGDPSHRKILRQLPVIMDITAPLYWWKQMDQYKIGTVTNSESTMHCMVKEPFGIEDFSTEHFDTIEPENDDWFKTEYFDGLVNNDAWIDLYEYFEEYHLGLLNSLREKYLETRDMNYWYLINELLPQSYIQTRTWSANYETLLSIIKQREGHKLSEWRQFIHHLLYYVPLLDEIYKTIKETKNEVINENSKS